jgi:hypothetical protein
MRAVIGLTTMVADGGVPVSVLQFRVTVVSATVPPLWNVARTLAAFNMPVPAVNAIRMGKASRAYCPIVVRHVRNIEVSIVDLPFSVWIVDDSTNTAAVKICRWRPYRLNLYFSLLLI